MVLRMLITVHFSIPFQCKSFEHPNRNIPITTPQMVWKYMEKNLVPVSRPFTPHLLQLSVFRTFISYPLNIVDFCSYFSRHTHHGNFTCQKLVTPNGNRRCYTYHKSIFSSKGYSRTFSCSTSIKYHHIISYVII